MATSGTGGTLFGNSMGRPLGTRPAWNGGKNPPYKSDEPCYKQQIPDYNQASSLGPSDAG